MKFIEVEASDLLSFQSQRGAFLKLLSHPFFEGVHDEVTEEDGTLIGAMLQRLDNLTNAVG